MHFFLRNIACEILLLNFSLSRSLLEAINKLAFIECFSVRRKQSNTAFHNNVLAGSGTVSIASTSFNFIRFSERRWVFEWAIDSTWSTNKSWCLCTTSEIKIKNFFQFSRNKFKKIVEFLNQGQGKHKYFNLFYRFIDV